ncbi:acyl-CoA dehydrogenase family protein [Pimelobacter simplex]|uniref:acyl-CoA dehydrogenase family protein n=1 Tax=Nocardioides simplex TaxID=2045 RepID=UPI001931EA8B|nr:acyl-CoA dehydrogenase family protein [Pimelobacter simplex]
MSIALDADEEALAQAAAELCRRRAPLSSIRDRLEELACGDRGAGWSNLHQHGLLTLHLAEEIGGGGATLVDLAVVAEQLGRQLLAGPWLPTVLASGALATVTDDSARTWLDLFVEGAAGAVVLGGLTAVELEDGLRVSGGTDVVPGLIGADIVLARAELGDGRVWFVLRPGEVDLRQVAGIDLTLSAGRFELDAHPVPPERIMAVDDEAADLVGAALVAAQAAGVAAWAVETAAEHLRTRHQFGKPLGAFQVLQHRAAMMLVRAEAAAAAAWDAARAPQQRRDQWRLATAQALVTAAEPAVDVVFDLVTLLGALGVTWEHDAHLYLRRASALAGLFGPSRHWARVLGEAVRHGERSSRLDDPAALPELRAEVGAVLDEFVTLPAEDDRHLDAWGRWTGGDRQALLADARLMAPHLPAPYGRGAGPQEQAVIADEFGRRGLVQPTLIVGDWALATLVAHGSDEQRTRFVDASQRGDIIWCQLFSEPEAGSDLASLRTRATRVDGGWRLSGQKIWNSRACESQWGICLARTDAEAAKHRGLTYFLVDMASPGVLARPIQQMNGQAELAEVFLDDVFVPDDCVVGEPGEGWRLAMATLSSERLNMGSRLRYGSSGLARRLLDDGAHRADEGDVLAVVGECAAREICLASMNLRTVLGRMSGRDMAAENSVNKVLSSIAQRDGSRALFGLLGPSGLDAASPYVADHLGMPAILFGGGTIEVQLNVIASRILNLPKA